MLSSIPPCRWKVSMEYRMATSAAKVPRRATGSAASHRGGASRKASASVRKLRRFVTSVSIGCYSPYPSCRSFPNMMLCLHPPTSLASPSSKKRVVRCSETRRRQSLPHAPLRKTPVNSKGAVDSVRLQLQLQQAQGREIPISPSCLARWHCSLHGLRRYERQRSPGRSPVRGPTPRASLSRKLRRFSGAAPQERLDQYLRSQPGADGYSLDGLDESLLCRHAPLLQGH